MGTKEGQPLSRNAQIAIGAIVVLALALGIGVYQYLKLNKENDVRGQEIHRLEGVVRGYENELQNAQEENSQLVEALKAEQERLRALGEQVEEITGTVGNLEKLARLEPELLQKYSKVYFLNEHYTPPRLREIDREYLYYEDQEHELDARVLPYLEDMVEDALDDDIKLFVRSAYRSFGTQSVLKSGYTVTYGTGANQFSADQGYSEHQLGTTVDFTTTGIDGGLAGFDTTPAYEWLVENAYKYGFTLSYPENNSFYIFEPWHWRFVGKDLARDLNRKDRSFYDLSQREIDEYLLEIFD